MRGLKYIYKREDLRETGDGRWERGMLGELRVESMESVVSCKEEDEEKKGSRIPDLGKTEENFRGKGEVCDEMYTRI